MVVLRERCAWDLILTRMTHPFRPADPPIVPTPPVGIWTRVQRAWKGRLSLARVAGLLDRHQIRRALCILALVVGLVVQTVLVVLVAELVHLSVSLMEVWVELARKHLEITL